MDFTGFTRQYLVNLIGYSHFINSESNVYKVRISDLINCKIKSEVILKV